MPELPEVETTLQGISPYIDQQKIKNVNIYNLNMRWPVDQQLPKHLFKKSLLSIVRRGKYLIFTFDNGYLLLHLGMSGSLRVVNPKIPPEKHDHFEIIFKNNKALRLHDPRRFGAVVWTEEPWQQHKLIKHLGPEPLSEEFTAAYLHKKSRKKTVCIKTFIMNSQVVVGVGNIYASESLYLAGIRPTINAGRISLKRYESLVAAIKQVLAEAIKQGGTTLRDFSSPEGKPGYFAQKLQVYGRAGEACYQCDNLIKQKTIANRATYYCTKCQH